MDIKNIKNYTVTDTNVKYENEKECELAEIASQKLEKDNTEAHYRFINIITITLLLIFSAVLFLTVSGSNIVDDSNNVLSWKTFLSGDYTKSLKTSYDNDLPFPDEMKMLEERLSLIYGIGNKVSDPVKEVDEETDEQHNSFDEPTEPEEPANSEKVVTSVVTDEMGITVTSTAPDDYDETTTTTSASATTTNTDPPEFTVTETYPVSQPGPTQTQPPETPTQTQPPETPTQTEETEPPEPVDSEEPTE